MQPTLRTLLLAALLPLTVAAGPAPAPFTIIGQPITKHYDGDKDDLLTAGLGRNGLAGPAPTLAEHPSPEQLRQLAIYVNYRALVDVSEGGGFGLFWGPGVGSNGATVPEKIPGDETIALAEELDGTRVTFMIQIPDSFNPSGGCLVTAPSSGSRGVYGAIATAGEWGLKNGCAVAYTDKGTGTGFDDLEKGLVTTFRGEVAPLGGPATAASQFTANLSPSRREVIQQSVPNRLAFKHAHSQTNPEADWGQYVLQSIQFAFTVLQGKYKGRVTKRNTVVIASSVSNGGGASVRAAEQDVQGLVDALVVGEPNVTPVYARFAIQQGDAPPFTDHSRPLIDYITLQNVFMGCAIMAPGADIPFSATGSAERCGALKAAGLLSGETLAEQATEAQALLNRFGLLQEQNLLQGAMWRFYVPQSIAVTYANTYGRFNPAEFLCGYSFGAGLPGAPALGEAAEANLFGTSSGIPPTAGVALINNLGPNGPAEDRISTPDQDLRGALCLRSVATGRDAQTGGPLPPVRADYAGRIAEGVQQILATGDLHGKPAMIVTGRADSVLPPNFTSRAYVGLNAIREGARSRLRYIEVKHAQHLDAFLAFPELKTDFLPLHRYYVQAMDLMLDHLRTRAALPPSQVIDTNVRGAGAPPLTEANLPPISPAPGPLAITFARGVLHVPE